MPSKLALLFLGLRNVHELVADAVNLEGRHEREQGELAAQLARGAAAVELEGERPLLLAVVVVGGPHGDDLEAVAGLAVLARATLAAAAAARARVSHAH